MSTTIITIVQKNWFMWPLLLAIVLEASGLSVSLYHNFDPNQPAAFLVAFAPTLVAPVLLAIANFSIFYRLVTWTIAANNRAAHPVWQVVHWLASLFPVLGATPVILYAMGLSDMCQYLSAKPIENAHGALIRILLEERGQRMLFNGHVAELVCLGIFAFLAVVSFAATPRSLAYAEPGGSKGASRLFWAISSVNALGLVRMVIQIVRYMTAASAIRDEMIVRSQAFWLFDLLPVLAAMIILCYMHPAQYLPEHFASVVFEYSDNYYDDGKA